LFEPFPGEAARFLLHREMTSKVKGASLQYFLQSRRSSSFQTLC